MSFREWISAVPAQAAAVGALPPDTSDELLRKSVLGHLMPQIPGQRLGQLGGQRGDRAG